MSRPILVTEAAPPHRIIGVNAAWTELCGYTEKEAIGKTPAMLLQGDQTDAVAATTFSTLLRRKGKASAVLTNKTKGGGVAAGSNPQTTQCASRHKVHFAPHVGSVVPAPAGGRARRARLLHR